MTPVTIIIPTWNNREYLQPCIESLIKYIPTQGLYDVLIINNGEKDSLDYIVTQNDMVKIIHSPENLGWEGGLKLGLEHTKSPFVVFMNDDTYIPASSRMWVHHLLNLFTDPRVGAAGPSSNVVMGSQNIFLQTPAQVFPVNYLVGFCMMLRREALEKAGGIDDTLPGGDDLDISIRLRQAGYSLKVNKDAFVYHHGFKSGTRLVGDHTKSGGWNSYEMMETTNLALIRKHGLKAWYECLYKTPEYHSYAQWEDTEGNIVRKHIQGEVVVDLGCGNNKTIPEAIGMDMVPKDTVVETLSGNPKSVADVVGDVSQPLPFEKNSVDTIIARHILEHLVDTVQTLKQWIEVIKPGGRLIIAVPDQNQVNSIPMNIEHVHAFTKEYLGGLLELLNIKIFQKEDCNNGISFVIVGEKV